MAFLLQSTSKSLPLFFNVSANVGRGCPNQAEDVALVSFLLVKWVEASGGPATRSLAAKVTLGTYDQNLQALIDSLLTQHAQSSPGAIADGHVSRAAPGTTYVHGGKQGYLICMANYGVAKASPGSWPRLDLFPGAKPGAIKLLIDREVLPG